ncbi:hypothetical protein FDECE_4172 [Fusarium decemcellulare]|nr:hypothetical protein FDECE_4172 [Fusarium decemcellulare]
MSRYTVARRPDYEVLKADHCELCQFKLVENERVLAYFGEEMFTMEYRYRSNGVYHEDSAGAEVSTFISTLGSDLEMNVCLHRSCYRVASTVFSISIPKLLDITRCLPHPTEGDGRSAYLHHALTEKLQAKVTLPRHIPGEIWALIASYWVSEAATATAAAAMPKPLEDDEYLQDDGVEQVDMRWPIYATYVKFNGRHYLRSLHNSPTAPCEDLALVRLRPRPEKPADRSTLTFFKPHTSDCDMFIDKDGFGVRQVFFVSPLQRQAWNLAQPTVPDADRTCLSGVSGLENDGGMIYFRTDGLKVRRIWRKWHGHISQTLEEIS